MVDTEGEKGFFEAAEFLAPSVLRGKSNIGPICRAVFLATFSPGGDSPSHRPTTCRRSTQSLSRRSLESTKQRPPARQLYFRSINQRLQTAAAAAERNIICFRNAAVISPNKSDHFSAMSVSPEDSRKIIVGLRVSGSNLSPRNSDGFWKPTSHYPGRPHGSSTTSPPQSFSLLPSFVPTP